MIRALALAALAFVACKRSEPPQATSTTIATATATTTATAASSSAASRDAAPPATPKSARDVVERWNAALDAHDLDALATLYGKSVEYYGTHTDGASCVKRIAAALAKDPSYHQDIDITYDEVARHADERGYAIFTKKDGKKTHDAYIMVDDAFGIAVESDRETDKTLVRTGRCFDYGVSATLRGKLVSGQHIIWGHVYDGFSLELDRSVCTLDTDFKLRGLGANDGIDYAQSPRIDSSSIDLLHRADEDLPSTLVGKPVAVTGAFLPHATQDHVGEHFSVVTIAAR